MSPTLKYLHFSFAIVDPEIVETDPNQQVAIVSGSCLVDAALPFDDRTVVARIKAALATWFLTPDGIDALAETGDCFTILDLEDYYYPQIEDLLYQQGIIDLQIDIEFVIKDLNLTDPLNQ